MRAALADARLAPRDVAYINAHATSTELGDRAELDAVCAVFAGACTCLYMYVCACLFAFSLRCVCVCMCVRMCVYVSHWVLAYLYVCMYACVLACACGTRGKGIRVWHEIPCSRRGCARGRRGADCVVDEGRDGAPARRGGRGGGDFCDSHAPNGARACAAPESLTEGTLAAAHGGCALRARCR